MSNEFLLLNHMHFVTEESTTASYERLVKKAMENRFIDAKNFV